MTVASAKEQPVHLVLSGPAGGVIGGAALSKLIGYKNLITHRHGRHQSGCLFNRWMGRPELKMNNLFKPCPSPFRPLIFIPLEPVGGASPGSTMAGISKWGRRARGPCLARPAITKAATKRPLPMPPWRLAISTPTTSWAGRSKSMPP